MQASGKGKRDEKEGGREGLIPLHNSLFRPKSVVLSKLKSSSRGVHCFVHLFAVECTEP